MDKYQKAEILCHCKNEDERAISLFVLDSPFSYYELDSGPGTACSVTMTLQKVEEGVRPWRATKLCSVVVDPTRKFKYGIHHQLLPPFSGSNFLASALVFNIFISRCPLQLILKL